MKTLTLYIVLHPGVIVAKEENGDTMWSDLDLAKEHGRLSAIEVEVEEFGGWIQRLRARCFPPQSPTLSPGTAPTTGLLGEEQEGRIATHDLLASWFSPPGAGWLDTLTRSTAGCTHYRSRTLTMTKNK